MVASCLEAWVKPKLPLLPPHCPSPPSVNPPSVCPSIHPSIRPSMDGRVDAGEGLGWLSGFQGGVSGPPPPQAGKLRLRKEPSRPLQTTTYSTTSSSPMSRLENLNHQQRTYSLFHYTQSWNICFQGWMLKSTDLTAVCTSICRSKDWLALTFGTSFYQSAFQTHQLHFFSHWHFVLVPFILQLLWVLKSLIPLPAPN